MRLRCEHGQILAHGMVRRVGWQAFTARHAALAIGVRLDQAGVDREALTTDQALGHASPDRRLEDLAQQIAVAEAAVAVLREGRVIGHVALEPEPAEPAIGEVEVDLVA